MDHGIALGQLERILESEVFRGAHRSRVIFRFLVTRTLEGHADSLKEYTIATEALGRGKSFDTRTDPIVRSEMSRLRQRLDLYYATQGRSDSCAIVLAKGSYVPIFEERSMQGGNATRAPGATSAAWKAAAAVLVVALGAAVWAPWRGAEVSPARPVVLDVNISPGDTLGGEASPDIAIAPDGTWLVFLALDADGNQHLYRRRLDQTVATKMPGTTGARVPFFSPDGQWVGFSADGKLKKILADGGSPAILCDAADLLGATWLRDDTIIAVLDGSNRVYRVPASGGSPVTVADFSQEVARPRWPQALPGGTHVLYTSVGPNPADGGTIRALSLADGTSQVLQRNGTYARYLPSGHLVYVNRGTLFAVRFDAHRLQVIGAPVPVLTDVSYSSTFGYAQYDVSDGGTLIYRRRAAEGLLQLHSIDPTGQTEPFVAGPALYQFPAVAPNGRHIAVAVVDGERSDIWTLEHSGDHMARRTFGDRSYVSPVWSPDGHFLIAAVAPGGIFWQSMATAAAPKPLLQTGTIAMPRSFTPDGTRLSYFEMNPQTGFDLWTVSVERVGSELRAGPPEVFLRSKAMEVFPTFSPDGNWIAYASNESGGWQVYVRAYPDTGQVVRVSSTGGRVPAWSSKRAELLFQTDEHRIMTARYRIEDDRFVADTPRPFAAIQLADTGVQPGFDTMPGGGIVGLVPARQTSGRSVTTQATIVFNFFTMVANGSLEATAK